MIESDSDRGSFAIPSSDTSDSYIEIKDNNQSYEAVIQKLERDDRTRIGSSLKQSLYIDELERKMEDMMRDMTE